MVTGIGCLKDTLSLKLREDTKLYQVLPCVLQELFKKVRKTTGNADTVATREDKAAKLYNSFVIVLKPI